MARVNYLLRGLNIPAGEHDIEFRFEPTSLRVTTAIAFTSIMVVLLAGVFVLVRLYRKRNEELTKC